MCPLNVRGGGEKGYGLGRLEVKARWQGEFSFLEESGERRSEIGGE